MPGKQAKKIKTPLPPVVDPVLARRIALKQRMGFILMAVVIVVLLVQGGQMLLKWHADQTQKAFFKAVNANDLTVVRQMASHQPQLLRARFSVNGATPLHMAVAAQHTALVALLLQRGADYTAIDYDGATLLHTAVEAGDLPTVQMLIARAAADHRPLNINQTMKYGFTPLHIAAARDDRANLVAFLLAHGANSTALTESGLTPLHIAARSGAQLVVKLLLAHGADPHARDRQGHTPADMARAARHDALADFLTHHAEKTPAGK